MCVSYEHQPRLGDWIIGNACDMRGPTVFHVRGKEDAVSVPQAVAGSALCRDC